MITETHSHEHFGGTITLVATLRETTGVNVKLTHQNGHASTLWVEIGDSIEQVMSDLYTCGWGERTRVLAGRVLAITFRATLANL